MGWTQAVRSLLGSSTRSAARAWRRDARRQTRRESWQGVEQLEGRILFAITTIDANTLTPQQLVDAILGTGVNVSNITFTGNKAAAGSFKGGTGIIGFEDGLILSSGKVEDVIGPNNSGSQSTGNAQPGDADLDAILAKAGGQKSQDAVVLEFDFVPAGSGELQFQYVFGSEEYNEYVYSSFNDVFGFLLDGVNIALLPDGVTPVAINTVNNGYGGSGQKGDGVPPTNPAYKINPTFYIDNAIQWQAGDPIPVGGVDTQLDGITVVLTAKANVVAGQKYHMKLAVADASDSALDSAVFIKGGSFGLEIKAPEGYPDLVGTAGQFYTGPVGKFVADPGADLGKFLVIVDYGDGSGTQYGMVTSNMDGTFNILAPNAPHIYKQPGVYTISFSVGQGAQFVGAQSTITIEPSQTLTGIGRTFTAHANTQFTTFVGTLTDVNPWGDSSNLAAFIDWGDGTTPTAAELVSTTIDANSVSGMSWKVFGTHTYAAGMPTRDVHFEIYDKTTAAKLASGSSMAMVADRKLATAAGQVTGGTITLLDSATGEVAQYIKPFEGWNGAINVATGDVTGDGIEDFIFAPGSGGGPWVAIYDGATGIYLSMFAAFDPSEHKGYTLATGDTNSDGIDDILVAEETGNRVRLFGGSDATVWWEFTPGGYYKERAVGSKKAYVFNQNTLNWNHPQYLVAMDRVYYNGGMRVALADITGDGNADVVIAPNTSRGGATGWAAPVVYYDGRTSLLIHSYMPFGSTYTGGVKIVGGDVTNDGKDDVALQTQSAFKGINPGAVFIHDIVGGTYRQHGFLPAGTTPTYDLGITDYNQDGVKDLVVSGLNAKKAKVTRVISGGTLLPIFVMG